MKTKFLTAANRKALPALYAQDGVAIDAHVCYVKYFNPYGVGTWLAMEFDGEDQFFGAVDLGNGWELGYFSLKELESVKARIAGREFPFQGIERDRFFSPKTYNEARAS
jgi:hypothetical protein